MREASAAARMRISKSASQSSVSGLVNEAILFWDDGLESNAYIVTNEEAQSRVRFLGEADIAKGWKAGYLIELGIRDSRGDRVDQNTPDGGSAADQISTRHSACMRIAEIAALKVRDCTSGVFNVRDAKSNAGVRRVPIHSALRSIVDRLTNECDIVETGNGSWRFKNRASSCG